MKKVINFSPGPAKLPEEVLERAKLEQFDYENSGISILEMSHRSKEFDNILHKTEHTLRDLMDIPQSYKVLFLQGGGTGQFAAIPLNLRSLGTGDRPSADYAITGTWSSKALKEADKYMTTHRCIQPTLSQYTKIPDCSHWKINKSSAYLYYCSNETIHGVEYNFVPETCGIPLVGDISSNVLTRHEQIRSHGILFAGTQKNLGTAGLTIAIVRDDLIGHADPMCPSILDYKQQAENNSIYNTPSVYSIYLTGLVLDWVKDRGGVAEMERQAVEKSRLIYDVIDDSQGFYYCPVEMGCRSRMNLPFRVGSSGGVEELEKAFLEESKKRGMISLKGHRSVGGIRASLYNAVTVQETTVLAEFMKEFYEKHGHIEP